MNAFGRATDEIIQRAMDEGAFDNLPGKGKPLKLDENPHEAEEWRTAYRVLRSSGHSLPWIEMRKEIEEAVDQALSDARSAWQSGSQEFWQAHLEIFQQRIEALNQRIFQYNLMAPSPQFHRQLLQLKREVEKVQGQNASTTNHPGGR